jgi:CheY-like chemotaxis protein
VLPYLVLVEDNPDHADLVRFAFDDVAEITVVESAEAAVALLDDQASRQQSPDALLIDINLPGVSGIDLLKRVKSQPQKFAMPAIMLTTSTAEGDRISAEQSRADGYFVKPLAEADVQAIRQLVAAASTRFA